MQSANNILVVDDTPTNIDILVELLKDEHTVTAVKDGAQALAAIARSKPDLVLLDIVMPDVDGYEVCRRIKESDQTRDIPVLFLTGIRDVESKKRGFDLGAVDYITKPFDQLEVLARVKTHLALKSAREQLKNQNLQLERKVEERTRELELTQEVTIESLAALAETRDNETGGHIRRTQRYVKLLAEAAAHREPYKSLLTPDVLRLIQKSAPLHDIGKVGVRDEILLKPAKLTDEEFELMKAHTTIGRDALLRAEAVLGTNSFLHYAREIAVAHHEKWDGSGYPAGLRGEAIPLPARIMAIADVYDALISKRVYKPPFPHKKAIELIAKDMGTHFDPAFAGIVEEVKGDLWGIASHHADSEEERLALGEA